MPKTNSIAEAQLLAPIVLEYLYKQNTAAYFQYADKLESDETWYNQTNLENLIEEILALIPA